MAVNSPGLGYLISQVGSKVYRFKALRDNLQPATPSEFWNDAFSTQAPFGLHISVWQGDNPTLTVDSAGEVKYLQVDFETEDEVVFYLEHSAITVDIGDTLEYKDLRFSNRTGDV